MTRKRLRFSFLPLYLHNFREAVQCRTTSTSNLSTHAKLNCHICRARLGMLEYAGLFNMRLRMRQRFNFSGRNRLRAFLLFSSSTTPSCACYHKTDINRNTLSFVHMLHVDACPFISQVCHFPLNVVSYFGACGRFAVPMMCSVHSSIS